MIQLLLILAGISIVWYIISKQVSSIPDDLIRVGVIISFLIIIIVSAITLLGNLIVDLSNSFI